LPSNWELVFGGVALILTLVASPEGIAGAAARELPRLAATVRRRFTSRSLVPKAGKAG
jgi:hypothetical protein